MGTKIDHVLPRTPRKFGLTLIRKQARRLRVMYRMNGLKGMPNGFRPTKAPDEKMPFPELQTGFELATAFAQCYL